MKAEPGSVDKGEELSSGVGRIWVYFFILIIAGQASACSGRLDDDTLAPVLPVTSLEEIGGTWRDINLHPRQNPSLHEFTIGPEGLLTLPGCIGRVALIGTDRILVSTEHCQVPLIPAGEYAARFRVDGTLTLAQTFRVAAVDQDGIRERWEHLDGTYAITLREDGAVHVGPYCQGYYEGWPNMAWTITFGAIECWSEQSPLANGPYLVSQDQQNVALNRPYVRVE